MGNGIRMRQKQKGEYFGSYYKILPFSQASRCIIFFSFVSVCVCVCVCVRESERERERENEGEKERESKATYSIKFHRLGF